MMNTCKQCKQYPKRNKVGFGNYCRKGDCYIRTASACDKFELHWFWRIVEMVLSTRDKA